MYPPYYIIPLVEKYRLTDHQSEEAGKLARLIAVNIGDKDTLNNILGENAHVETLSNDALKENSFSTIDSFLDKFGQGVSPIGYMSQQPLREEEKIKEDDSETEESDLRHLIKQRRFEEALQLIERQNLNNPQKSIYFAHQMRFIKKLIVIDKYRNKTNG